MENLRDMRLLFYSNEDFYACIGDKEFTNKEIQKELFDAHNQANELEYEVVNNRVSIWNPNTETNENEN